MIFVLLACTSPTTGTPDEKADPADTTPVDSDGDGINDADEAAAGTDPSLADTDADGLSDSEEAAAGTDPLAMDTDSDGYTDYDEVQTGHDPLNMKDKIYTGGWPYNPDKDSMENPGWGGSAAVNGMLPHFVSYDQYGDTFDVYDFAGQGSPVIIDVSAGWCYYCQEMSKLVAGQRSFFDDYAASYPGIGGIKDAVDSGEVLWIEILDQTDQYATVDQDFLEAWEATFPNDRVAVVADEDQRFAKWLPIAGYPTIFAMNADLKIKSFSQDDYISALNWAVSHAGAGAD